MTPLFYYWSVSALPVPLPVILPIALLNLILAVVALVDLIRAERTQGPKWLWAVLIVCVQLLGPVLYFVFGRRRDA